jgi:predicted transcriptional regulator
MEDRRMGRGVDPLSRRERQIMEIVFRRGRATAVEVHGDLPDAPSRTAVRTLLRILEDKGHLRHTQNGLSYVYEPTRGRTREARSALRRLLDTFFEGSFEKAAALHLSEGPSKLSPEELDRLAELIRQAKKKGT